MIQIIVVQLNRQFLTDQYKNSMTVIWYNTSCEGTSLGPCFGVTKFSYQAILFIILYIVYIFLLVQYFCFLYIMKTCLYNFDPLKPNFYIVKLGFTGVYIIFLFLLKNIDCGYSLEPPRRGGSNEYPQSMF